MGNKYTIRKIIIIEVTAGSSKNAMRKAQNQEGKVTNTFYEKPKHKR